MISLAWKHENVTSTPGLFAARLSAAIDSLPQHLWPGQGALRHEFSDVVAGKMHEQARELPLRPEPKREFPARQRTAQLLPLA